MDINVLRWVLVVACFAIALVGFGVSMKIRGSKLWAMRGFALSAGVMLGVSLTHIMPESVELVSGGHAHHAHAHPQPHVHPQPHSPIVLEHRHFHSEVNRIQEVRPRHALIPPPPTVAYEFTEKSTVKVDDRVEMDDVDAHHDDHCHDDSCGVDGDTCGASSGSAGSPSGSCGHGHAHGGHAHSDHESSSVNIAAAVTGGALLLVFLIEASLHLIMKGHAHKHASKDAVVTWSPGRQITTGSDAMSSCHGVQSDCREPTGCGCHSNECVVETPDTCGECNSCVPQGSPCNSCHDWATPNVQLDIPAGTKERSPSSMKGLVLASTPTDALESTDCCKDIGALEKMSELSALACVIGVSFHAVCEGLGLGSSSSQASLMKCFLAISLHKGLEGFVVGSSAMQCNASKRRILAYLLVTCGATPLGALIGWLVAMNESSNTLKGIMQAVSAGTFLYVALNEMLPRAFSKTQLTCKREFLVLASIMSAGYIGSCFLGLVHYHEGHGH